MNAVEISSDFQEFVASPFAQVILRMSGCHDLVVNTAHTRVFGVEQFQVAESPAQILKHLLKPTSRLKRVGHLDGPSQQCEPCYCGKIGAVYALRSEFCPFETAFSDLERGASETRGIGFFQVNQIGLSRTYSVHRVYAKRLPQESVMHCWILPVTGLTVTLTSQTPSENPPRKLARSCRWNGEEWLRGETVLVPEDSGYCAFDGALKRALTMFEGKKAKPEAIKQFCLDWIRKCPTEVDYEPIEGSLLCLFERNDQHSPMEEISRIRERLFDALVLKELEDRIEESAAQAFLASCKDLQSDLECSLARSFLTIGQVLAVSSNHLSGYPSDSAPIGRDQKEQLAPKGGAKMENNDLTKKIEWKADLDLYPDRKALKFNDRKERDKLLGSLWSDRELIGMPRDYAGALILIVPQEAVELLQRKGFTFRIQDVVWGN